jgi:hypothetical protein
MRGKTFKIREYRGDHVFKKRTQVDILFSGRAIALYELACRVIRSVE